jgi:uncharacterized protein
LSVPALRIGLSELRRRPGNRSEVHRSVPLHGVGVSTAAVPDGAEATVDVTLEALSDGVTVRGHVEAPWEGECRRCLESTSGTVVAEVHEVFKDHADEGETLPLDGESLDLGQVVHDAVVLALPLAPLCRPDCPGPDPDQFPVTAAADEPGGAGDDEPDPPRGDPRWAALDELRFDSDAGEQ